MTPRSPNLASLPATTTLGIFARSAMKALAFLSIILTSACLCAAKEKPEWTALRNEAQAFYTKLRSERIYGLPSAQRLQDLSPHFTPALRSVLAAAGLRMQRQIKLHPDEKPELVEDDIFSSHAGGVTQWELGEVFSAPTVDGSVEVKCKTLEPGQPEALWTDKLIFKQNEGRWLLDDIHFGADWVSDDKTLRSLLPGGQQKSGDHLSDDERWRVVISRSDREVTGITVQPAADSAATPQLLFGENHDAAAWGASVLWNPTGDMIALSLNDEPRFARTMVYRLVDGRWQPVDLPELYAVERKTLDENGFHERHRRIEPHHWQDEKTLVIDYFGNFTKGDEGDGFDKQVSVAFASDGSATITGAVEKQR